MNKQKEIETLEDKIKKAKEELLKFMKEIYGEQVNIDFSNLKQLHEKIVDNKTIPRPKKIETLTLIRSIIGMENGIKKQKDLPPEENDGLYDNILYFLRLTYYKFYDTNPTIQKGRKIQNPSLFGDPTLPIDWDKHYKIIGPFNFNIMFHDGKITITFTEGTKEGLTDKDIKFISELFNRYNSSINIILSNRKEYFLSCVEHYFDTLHTYSDFFERLYDNLRWNTIYIDSKLKEGVPQVILDKVDAKVAEDIKRTAIDIGISEDELRKRNSELANYIIKGTKPLKLKRTQSEITTQE